MKKTVPIKNIDILEGMQPEDGSPAESKEPSQMDNSLIKMLQKSQMMCSEIGSKELDALEAPTKSFDEGMDKSDTYRSHTANNRSVKAKPGIFAYQAELLAQEHSPIRSRQNMRYSGAGEPQVGYETFKTLEALEEVQEQEDGPIILKRGV